MKTIEYKGKTYTSDEDFDIISDEEFNNIKKEWYSHCSLEQVKGEIIRLNSGSTKIAFITDYYFVDLMNNTIGRNDKWSINEIFESKELLSVVVHKVNKAPQFFDNESIKDNIEKYFRLGGKGYAHKVSQFPVKTVDMILSKYNVNNVWYDYSCGWGGRLTGALKNGVNYYGTDPNNLLVDKLKCFAADWKSIMKSDNVVDIRCCGSEVFQEDLVGKVGVAFSSPPYFDLEDYIIGEQSYKEGVTYNMWLNNYLKKTIENIYKYLVDDGYFICNIKDYSNFTLEKDLIDIAKDCGFELYKIDVLDGATRVGGSVGNDEIIKTDMSENIYVFNKIGFKPLQCEKKVVELW